MKRSALILAGILTSASFGPTRSAHAANKLSQLRQELAAIRASGGVAMARHSVQTAPFADCSRVSVTELATATHGRASAIQYIYNSVYKWAYVSAPDGNGECIYLMLPIKRGLTSHEAEDLFTASRTSFPVPKTSPQANGKSANGVKRTPSPEKWTRPPEDNGFEIQVILPEPAWHKRNPKADDTHRGHSSK